MYLLIKIEMQSETPSADFGIAIELCRATGKPRQEDILNLLLSTVCYIYIYIYLMLFFSIQIQHYKSQIIWSFMTTITTEVIIKVCVHSAHLTQKLQWFVPAEMMRWFGKDIHIVIQVGLSYWY